MKQLLLRRITLRSFALRLLQTRDAGAAISEVARTYCVSHSTILRMVANNSYHCGPALIRTVLFSVALGVSTPGTAQAQVSNSRIVVQEAAAIVHDLLSGGTSLLQYNWNECMTHVAATHDKNFADQCLFYTYGAILADPGFGANNTQEKLATEQNVSVGLNLLFQI